jgi:Zn-dependent peptidase ImmA (M78 family)
MSTSARGDAFEEEIYEFFHEKISADDFYFRKECCKLFRKKRYFSRDRQDEIEFDVVVEVYSIGDDRPSILFIVECKNYNHAVPVNDAEEFFQKIQQISGANVKAVIASPATFQSGTVAFSQSKGIALMQYLGAEQAKWHLARHARGWTRPREYDKSRMLSVLQLGSDTINGYDEIRALVEDNAASTINRMVHYMVRDVVGSLNGAKQIVNTSRRHVLKRLPFKSKADIECVAESALLNAVYKNGAVPLERICVNLRETRGLLVERNVLRPAHLHVGILGRLFFAPPRITTFQGSDGNSGRERFTLAHEIGHLLLGHGDFLAHDSVDQFDGLYSQSAKSGSRLIDRMEWQANHFSSCLLMPKATFKSSFFLVIQGLNLQNRGFGSLYVDDQRCNVDNLYYVLSALAEFFEVSRTAAEIRLKQLGLLNDKRSQPQHASQFVNFSATR